MDDDNLGTMESIALGSIVVLLIGGVGIAIAREGRKLDGGARRKRRGRRLARVTGARKRGSPSARPGARAGDRRDGAKAPPPPPRKRRPKAKRR